MTPRKKTAAAAPPESKPCLANWQWWKLDGPCGEPAHWRDYCRAHSEQGPGWRREWATSAFDGVRYRYIVKDGVSPPWDGLDDLSVERGWTTREPAEPLPAADDAPAF